ncbi:MAG: helicase-related protein [Pseudomonadota bacterium]
MIARPNAPLLRSNRSGRDVHGDALPGGDGVIGVLGPTNTGKTYFAIERMLAHRTGMIGLPLRLLAREVYDKLVPRIGSQNVALITGEEKIIPKSARYWVATVEAMPLDREVEFLAVDEIQLAADPERGRVFTSRLLNARGVIETVFIGSATMASILRRLFPGIDIVSKERFSTLEYAGSKKVTRLPRRSAIVGFSADTVYAIAELVRRQRGGAAVVLGALSPRTRNAQADLYQNGDVDYLVATDAIGMGLNMDIDHVGFAAKRKFDGKSVRDLSPAELAQIAGRAGRHTRDGAFGVTADCAAFDDETVEAIENHSFAAVDALQWRSERLDFSSFSALRVALDRPPPNDLLRRCRPAEDELALSRLGTFVDVKERASGGAALALLWDVCQIPDFRKSAFDQHARLLSEIYEQLVDRGRMGEHWFEAQIAPFDRTDGDIDVISNRIAHVRTWTYLANRAGWVDNASYWQGKTRSIEDALSDALHEKLTQRFVDRRTSVLARKLRDDAPLLAGVTDDGEVIVEGQFVGRLTGFEFILDPRAKGLEAKKARHAAERALTPILAARGAALANAEPGDLRLEADATIWWRSSPVAVLEKGPTPLRPNLKMRGLDAIPASLRGRVHDRLTDYLASRIEALLSDLLRLKQAVDAEGDGALPGLARGVGFRLVENFGAMSRAPIASELKQLGQDERGKLRQIGVRFGEYTLHMPSLLKPGPAGLLTMLWALWADKAPATFQPPKAGLVSILLNKDLPHAYYYASGYRPSGERAVRIDMLERLAGVIRTARGAENAKGGFEANQQMMSLVGCSGEEFESILRSLGYRKQTIKRALPKADATPPETSASETSSPETAGSETLKPASAAPEAETPATETPEASVDAAAAENNTATATPESASSVDGEIAAAAPTEASAMATDAGTPEGTGESVSVSEPPEATKASAEGEKPEPTPEAAASPTSDAKENAAPSGDAPAEPSAAVEAQPKESSNTAVDAAAETEEIEVEIWRMAPRRPPRRDAGQGRRGQSGEDRDGGQKRRHGKNGSGQQEGRSARDGDGKRGPDGGPNKKRRFDGKKGGKKHDGPRPPRRYSSEPRRGNKGPDPDSPFAVLAALKTDGDGGAKGS